MKLPTRGCLVTTAGQITWAWEHNNPGQDFDSLPPLQVCSDGTNTILASPTDLILDLTAPQYRSGDIKLLYRDMQNTRARKQPDGSWKFTQIIDGVEVDHPLQLALQARRRPQ